MSDERGQELDAATLEQYRAAVERAAAEIRTPEVRAALTGGVGKLLAALARRDEREREAATEVKRLRVENAALRRLLLEMVDVLEGETNVDPALIGGARALLGERP